MNVTVKIISSLSDLLIIFFLEKKTILLRAINIVSAIVYQQHHYLRLISVFAGLYLHSGFFKCYARIYTNMNISHSFWHCQKNPT